MKVKKRDILAMNIKKSPFVRIMLPSIWTAMRILVGVKMKILLSSVANAAAFTVALIGTAFMAGATFAVVHEPPVIWLCILLAVPGFIGWIFPYFIHNGIARKKEQAIQPLIEKKYEEIYEICEKGHSLL